MESNAKLEDKAKDLKKADQELLTFLQQMEEKLIRLNLKVVAQVKLRDRMYLSFEPFRTPSQSYAKWRFVIRDHTHPQTHPDRVVKGKRRSLLHTSTRDRIVAAVNHLENLFENLNKEVLIVKEEIENASKEAKSIVEKMDFYFTPATKAEIDILKQKFKAKKENKEQEQGQSEVTTPPVGSPVDVATEKDAK